MAAASGGGASGGGASVDLDIAAMENIPRDTLVALLKRKDKEAKSSTAKLDKLEERYVKVVRFNKLLMEDRTSFQRFCSDLLPESEGIFEEAAAQETPVNLDALLRRLQAWRSTFEAVSEDRKVFQQFVELVFPGDERLAELFQGASLGAEAFDTLQQRWLALEDLHNQSMASINCMAREQMTERGRELEDARAAKAEAERRMEEMREQMTKMAREKAQSLKRRLAGGAAGDAEAEQELLAAAELAEADLRGGGAPSARDAAELRDLGEQLARSERKEREAREAAERRERDLQSALEQQEVEATRLRKELDSLRDETDKKGTQTRQLLAEKESVLDQLQKRLDELEKELGSNDFIVRAAEQQAGRDAEVKQQRRELDQLQGSLGEIQRLLTMSYSQERVLKDRIRELEQSQGRGHVAGDYLKHVVLQYIKYNQSGDLKAQTLVPVLAELLKLGSEERKAVEAGPAIPQPLLVLNQAVGGASMWLRGGATPTADGRASSAASPDLPG